jgi:hypothetical protein
MEVSRQVHVPAALTLGKELDGRLAAEKQSSIYMCAPYFI